MSASVDSLVSRLSDVERRLADHAAAPLPTALSEPDPGAEERWEAGQVWAHLAEFPRYWLSEAERVIARLTPEPVAFGRVKTDPGRLEAIERERHTDPAALLDRVRGQLAEVTDAVRSWTPEAWARRGAHPVRGEMTVERIVTVFIADHLEEHADQLDAMTSRG